MVQLDAQGQKLLVWLTGLLPNVKPGKPQTYTTYKAAHQVLRLVQRGRTFGESLRDQGLGNLTEWTIANDLPAIAGLVVSEESFMPGQGFFDAHGQKREAYGWWDGEIAKAKAFDWSVFSTR